MSSWTYFAVDAADRGGGQAAGEELPGLINQWMAPA